MLGGYWAGMSVKGGGVAWIYWWVASVELLIGG